MIIHRSNRAEALIEALADVVDTPCGGPFEPERLVVQGQGMERWIAMELAKRRGVWANQQVMTLRGLVSDVALRVLGEDVDPVFDPESMSWSIADTLFGLEARPGFEAIANYLAGDDDGRRRLQLSQRIAETFYRYMGYREEMLRAWQSEDAASAAPAPGGDREQADDDLVWQAALWRELEARHGAGHLAARGRALIERLDRGEFEPGCLPGRLSIFGVSTLPKLHLDLVRALARHVEIHLFVLSPTPEYWGDVATDREARRSLKRDGGAELDAGKRANELHLDLGHPLLASFGKLGRDFHASLVEGGDLDFEIGDLHAPPEGGTVLAGLQRDVYRLERPGRDGVPRRRLEAGDRSLRVHACHGSMREVEVLCEELIASFEADPTLDPQDVVVMTPDIKHYAPYIEAVFGVRERSDRATTRGEGEIPYRIADRWPDPRDEVIDAFFAGLDVVIGRFAAPDVFDLLGRPCVAECFGLTRRDLEIIEGWLESSGIRWGVDQAHRVEEAQPATSANTWRFGLDRLLLGVALEGGAGTLFAEVQPDGEAEGQRAETLERLLEAVGFLEAARLELSDARSPAAFCDALGHFLSGLIADDDDRHDQHLLLKRTLGDVAAQAENAGYERELILASFREQVERQLRHARRSTGFLAGGVTFCELVPMRSIPFRVVGLLGMNDGVFPRVDHPPGFDWMARKPERGDRSTRDDDRFLFLEALLSARDRLVITYVGQSVRDGSVLPPSVAVSELLDVVCDSFDLAEGAASNAGGAGADERERVRSAIEIRHPLHAHGRHYFDGTIEGFPIHRRVHRELATIDIRSALDEQPFVSGVAAALEDGEPGRLAVDDLVAFYQAPVRSYLRDGLGIVLRPDREPIAHREPYRLAPLERSNVGQRLLDRALSGSGAEEAWRFVRASGALPQGKAGRLAFDEVWRDVEAIAVWSETLGANAPRQAVPFAFACGGVELTGRFERLCDGGQVFTSFGRLGRGSELRAWIWHLTAQVCSKREPAEFSELPRHTVVLGRAEDGQEGYAIRFGPVEDAERHLERLIARYREGRHAPLPLFPGASRSFAAKIDGAEDAAWSAARRAYEVDDFSGFGDSLDENTSLAFRGLDPLDPEVEWASAGSFAELAVEIMGPLLAAREPA